LKKNHKYTLFGAKYTYELERFCIENKLGHSNNRGLAVSRDVGFMYMTILAHAIGNAQSISPITDRAGSDRFTVLTNKPTEAFGGQTRIAQAVIELQLPSNLSEIPLEQVIAFRARHGFKERMGAFHEELEGWIRSVEKGKATGDFFQTRGSALKDFSDEIASISSNVAMAGLGVWALVNSLSPEAMGYMQESLAAVGVSVGSIITVRKAWEATKPRRLTRKYLVKLKKLRPIR
jgi:hypothetical protein